eukprot:TRINITY_DN2892_c1_g1_i1.p2 TRINITY_DN2892_c1_g1~~TRINITY_DN2892_c1_g1_i1.p2  ORF type:complete len:301 (-),score=34.39 TRINITY_DN2892_c1_g1_i1:126-905(-)
MEKLLVVLFVFLSCSAVQSDPWKLSDYSLCKRVTIPGVLNDASGATFANDTLLVLSNTPSKITEFEKDGTVKGSISITGFDDPEGITWVPPNQIAIAEESFGGRISIVDYDISEQNIVNSNPQVLRVNNNRNTGLEGVAYDERRDVFYMVVENDPRWVIEVAADGQSYKFLFAVRTPLKDLSGIYFAQQTQNLYIISQESQMVARYSRLGSLLELRPLEADRPEGIAFSDDGSAMYIISEPNMLLIYAAEGDCDLLEID